MRDAPNTEYRFSGTSTAVVQRSRMRKRRAPQRILVESGSRTYRLTSGPGVQLATTGNKHVGRNSILSTSVDISCLSARCILGKSCILSDPDSKNPAHVFSLEEHQHRGRLLA